MTFLENITDSEIKQFAANLGLNCVIPEREKLDDPIFKLYVVHADKLEAVYFDMGVKLIPKARKSKWKKEHSRKKQEDTTLISFN